MLLTILLACSYCRERIKVLPFVYHLSLVRMLAVLNYDTTHMGQLNIEIQPQSWSLCSDSSNEPTRWVSDSAIYSHHDCAPHLRAEFLSETISISSPHLLFSSFLPVSSAIISFLTDRTQSSHEHFLVYNIHTIACNIKFHKMFKHHCCSFHVQHCPYFFHSLTQLQNPF